MPRSQRRVRLVRFVCTAAVALGTASLTASPAAASRPLPGEPAPLAGHHDPFKETWLSAVSAVSSDDVWSVGSHQTAFYHATTVIRHWDGSAWAAFAHPDPGGRDALSDVAARSSDDVWAVGFMAPHHQKLKVRSLIEHWDGSAWTLVQGRNPGGNTLLASVSAESADDVWASGSTQIHGRYEPFVEHWDGETWQSTDLPEGLVGRIVSLSALSSTDVWALGATYVDGASGADVLHWDGSAWSVVHALPYAHRQGYELGSLLTISTTDVWAVGYHVFRDTEPAYVPYVLHWDGSTWSGQDAPAPPGWHDSHFTAVSGTSDDDLWAVGLQTNKPYGPGVPLVEHWDGSAWTVTGLPSLDKRTFFEDVEAIGQDDAWMVGEMHSNKLTLHWDGTDWSVQD
jgi:hypothetical protein